MINTHIRVHVLDVVDLNLSYGFRNIYIDKLGRAFIKLKGHYKELLNSYDYYEEKGRVYVDLENNIVY